MPIPFRYQRAFRLVLVARRGSSYRGGGERIFHWECRRCGQVIKPNNAGAQSHVAKHLREVAHD